MDLSGLNLGPFTLETRLGRGATAEVWRGRHRGQSVPVAIKLIDAHVAQGEVFRAALRREVEATARLSHPAIVTILDYGEVGLDEPGWSGRAKSPYLVTELLEHGTLAARPPADWPTLRATLLAILDGLAYAHARGVVHRDLKPANILWTSAPGEDPALKLIDFGIAALAQSTGDGTGDASGGTPAFMAPEQIQRAWWRTQGPWTDLYALGCATWLWCSGHLPFGGTSIEAVLRSHLTGPAPELGHLIETPPGLSDWVARLMARHPRDRPQHAADAAFELAKLDALVEGATSTATSNEHHVADLVDSVAWGETSAAPLDSLQWSLSPAVSLVEVGLAGQHVAHQTSTPLDAQRPPIPASWRGGSPSSIPPRLMGAGLRLYGLRGVPLIGREAARDRLWASLTEVSDVKLPGLVLIRGVAGVGKSHLARWLCERAHELGTAQIFHAGHNPEAAPSDALRRMLARHFNTRGLTPEALEAHLHRRLLREGMLGSHEWSALAAFLRRDQGENQSRWLTTRRAERFNLVMRALLRAASGRPAVVWFDDVQWGGDTLEFCRHLLDHAREAAPILLVLTARDEALAERPIESELLSNLGASPRSSTLALSPLPTADHTALVEHLLGLEGELVNRVVYRTRGNPLFAVHLIGDWIDRCLLTFHETGFRLQTDVVLGLDDDLHAVWSGRIERLLDEAAERHGPEGTQRAALAMEAAAALGVQVNERAWRAVCGHIGADASDWLVDALVVQRLATRTRRGWAFAHGLLRESLVRRCRDEGRWRSINRACADTLEARATPHKRETLARLGRHLFAAEAYAEALVPLHKAALRLIAHCEYRTASDLLSLVEQALTGLGAEESDGRWGALWLCRANVSIQQGRYADALHWAERAEHAARSWGWGAVQAEALLVRGEALAVTGRTIEAAEALTEGAELARDHRMRLLEARSLQRLAAVRHTQGDLDTEARFYQRALTICEEEGDDAGQGEILTNMAASLRAQGHYKDASKLSQRAIKIHRAVGNRRAEGATRANEALVAWNTGRLDEARALCADAIEIFREIGDRRFEGQALTNMGLIHKEMGRLEEASGWLTRALGVHRQVGHARSEAIAQDHLAIVAWKTGQIERARDLHARSIAIYRRIDHKRSLGFSLLDVARIARICADQPAQVEALIDEAAAIFDHINNPQGRILALCERAHLAIALGGTGEPHHRDALALLSARAEPSTTETHALEGLQRAVDAGSEALHGESPDLLPEQVRERIMAR